MSDYATQLLLQRGRDAGGIALEIVELYEEHNADELEKECEYSQALEDDIEALSTKLENLKDDHNDDIKEMRAEKKKFLIEVHKLLDVLEISDHSVRKAALEQFYTDHPLPK